MAEEKEACEECGSENILDVVYLGKMIKLCPTCARMNGAVIVKVPTAEQITRAEREVSLQEKVKAWRKERQTAPREANLDTLRRRKHELDRDKEKQEQEKFKKEIAEARSIIDFRSKEVTISDLRKMHEIIPQRTQITQKMAPSDEEIELEINDFMQEVKRIKDEEILEYELKAVPTISIEPLNAGKLEEQEEVEAGKEKEKKEEPEEKQKEHEEKEPKPSPEPSPEPWPPNPQSE